MTRGAEEEAPIYPQYCFRLSPTIGRWCPLRAADVARLTTHPGFAGQNLFFHLNHPIKWVRVSGVVVAIDEFNDYGRRVYTVDDSSGACIECVVNVPVAPAPGNGCAAPPAVDAGQTTAAATGRASGAPGANPHRGAEKPPGGDKPQVPIPDGLDVGSIVDVKGGIKVFREVKQVKVEKIVLVRSTAQELALWEKRQQFRADVLARPWALEDKAVRRCRREAEGLDHEVERRARKKRAAERATKAPEGGGDEGRHARERPTAGRAQGLERKKRSARPPPELKGKYDALGI